MFTLINNEGSSIIENNKVLYRMNKRKKQVNKITLLIEKVDGNIGVLVEVVIIFYVFNFLHL